MLSTADFRFWRKKIKSISLEYIAWSCTLKTNKSIFSNTQRFLLRKLKLNILSTAYASVLDKTVTIYYTV